MWIADRINTQEIYRLWVPDKFVNKHDVTVTLGWQDSSSSLHAGLFRMFFCGLLIVLENNYFKKKFRNTIRVSNSWVQIRSDYFDLGPNCWGCLLCKKKAIERKLPPKKSISSMYIRGLIPRNFAELAEAVPIAARYQAMWVDCPYVGSQSLTFCWLVETVLLPEEPFKTAAVRSTTLLSASDTNTSNLADRVSSRWTGNRLNKKTVVNVLKQGSHRNSKTQFHDFSMIFSWSTM